MTKMHELVKLMEYTDLSYNDSQKRIFLNLAQAVLKQISTKLNLKECKIRSNIGGIAVSGDAVLMGMWDDDNGIYIIISQGSHKPFMYRTIKGMTDYTGGHNNWLDYDDMTTLSDVAEKILRLNRKQ